MGEVWRARHASLGQRVVIKVLHSGRGLDQELVQRFLREARAAASIGSPHIASVSDFAVTAEGVPFLVMEHLEGCDLAELIRDGGPLSVERACDIARQILEAVGAAHRAGILHRDIKPANVFLTRDPAGGERVKLLDFGISKVFEGTRVEVLTRTGVLMGTPFYMAPEQFVDAREVDRRADLYSVAVILYEMLTGKLPHEATTLEEIITRVLSERPRSLSQLAPHLPPALAELVDRGLAQDPDARWQTAEAMAAELDRVTRSPAPLPQTRLSDAVPPPAQASASQPPAIEHVPSAAPPARASTVGSSKGLWVAGSMSLLALFLVYCLPALAVIVVIAAMIGFSLWSVR